MTRDELINAIDSPIVQALARVFDTPPQRMDKSFSEQIVEILAPKLISVRAQRLPSYVEQTEAGTINWKMEVERLNRLLANAQSPREQRRVPVMVPDKNSASGHRVEWLSIDVDSEISSLLDSATLPTPPAQRTRPVITDDMIDRAIEAHVEPFDSGDAVGAMRAALEAALTSTERRCQKCGSQTEGEEADVDGQIWCHPCADDGGESE